MKIRRLDPDARYRRVQWMLDFYEGPKRIRKFFKSKAEAEAEAGEKKEQHRHTGQSWLELAPEERSDLMHVVAESRERKVTIRQVWEAYKNGKLDATPMQRCTLQHAIAETEVFPAGGSLAQYQNVAAQIYAMMAAGIEDFEVVVPILRHTQTVSPVYDLSANLLYVGRILSTATLLSADGITMPQNIQNNLPTDAQPAAVPFNPANPNNGWNTKQYGWKKNFPSINQIAFRKMSLTQEYVYGLWETSIYSLTPGTIL